MTDVRIEFDPGDMPERLRGLAISLTDLRPLWPRVRIVAVGWLRQQLDTQGGFGGQRWAPLSHVYAQFKARVRPGRPLLVFDGGLRRAVRNPEAEYRPDTLTLRIVDEVARFHQSGTRIMPARPVIPPAIPPDAARELRAVVDDYIDETARRWGFR